MYSGRIHATVASKSLISEFKNALLIIVSMKAKTYCIYLYTYIIHIYIIPVLYNIYIKNYYIVYIIYN